MSNKARKNNKTVNNPTEKVYQKYPLLLTEPTVDHSITNKLFGIVVDKREEIGKKYDTGDGYIKDVTESKTYRYIFGIFKYLKRYNYWEWTSEKSKN